MRSVLDAELLTPLIALSKAKIVELAFDLPGCWAALSRTVTCYNGNQCGECSSCVLRAKGFAESGHRDPAMDYVPSNSKKLSSEQIVQIRRGDKGLRQLAREYGVCESTVRAAKNGYTWK